MKKSIVLLLPLLVVASAHAAVVDHFNCEITAVNADGSRLYQTKSDGYSLREPVDMGTNPTQLNSSGSFAINAAGDSHNQASISINYQFAVKYGADGTPLSAKQTLCMSENVSTSSSGIATACLTPSADAFAEGAVGWTDTKIKDGLPVFNGSELRSSTYPFHDGSKVTLACYFLGTEK